MGEESIVELRHRIHQLREEWGYSQDQLGNILGVSGQLISMYESGKRQLTADKLWAIAEIFGVSPTRLVKDYRCSDDLRADVEKRAMHSALTKSVYGLSREEHIRQLIQHGKERLVRDGDVSAARNRVAQALRGIEIMLDPEDSDPALLIERYQAYDISVNIDLRERDTDFSEALRTCEKMQRLVEDEILPLHEYTAKKLLPRIFLRRADIYAQLHDGDRSLGEAEATLTMTNDLFVRREAYRIMLQVHRERRDLYHILKTVQKAKNELLDRWDVHHTLGCLVQALGASIGMIDQRNGLMMLERGEAWLRGAKRWGFEDHLLETLYPLRVAQIASQRGAEYDLRTAREAAAVASAHAKGRYREIYRVAQAIAGR